MFYSIIHAMIQKIFTGLDVEFFIDRVDIVQSIIKQLQRQATSPSIKRKNDVGKN